MLENYILVNVITLIATAVFIVIVFRYFKLSPVLGYLVAGILIGNHGLNVVDSNQIKLLGEFGVVFLLFAIGLELSFERLKAMRKYVFGLGTLQVLFTSIIITAIASVIYNNNTAVIIGGGLALSSTALVMRVIDESRNQSTQIGRVSLSILILQDFAVVPLLVIIPLLGNNNGRISIALALGYAFIKALIALVVIFTAGRLLLRPLFDLISSDNIATNELPIAMTLLIVLSAAWGTEYFGLSLALGAFVAGVLVAETDFRLQAEESIEPFKSLLLGLFFMTVGMGINIKEIYEHTIYVVSISFCLIFLKTLIIFVLCILFGFNKSVALNAGIILSQGSEFTFVLFDLARRNNVIEEKIVNILLLVITFTMALTPILAAIGQKMAEKLEKMQGKTPLQKIEFSSRDLVNHVIIAGFGKVGKMVARVLEVEEINYIALDINNDLVNREIVNGFPAFRGDVSQIDVLKAVGAERALTVILTMSNEITIKKALKAISQNFLNVNIIIRLKNLKKADEFYDAGASTILPVEYETGLMLGALVLRSVGISENEVNRINEQFRMGNYLIAKQENNFLESEEND